MYDIHAMEISEHALKTPQGLLDVITFVFTTIQQPLSSCKNQLNDIDLHGTESKYLFGSKRAGLKYAIENKTRLFWKVQELQKESLDNIDTVSKAVRLFMEVPGLGAVKASFVCQMLGFNVSCIDSHNLNRLGMELKDVTIPNSLTEKTKMKKIKAYVHLTQRKGTVYWWNSWCDYVASKGGMNKTLTTGNEVSAFHVECVIR
jgi:hypothetical protein